MKKFLFTLLLTFTLSSCGGGQTASDPCGTTAILAGATVTTTASGNGLYLVQGTDMADVSGMEMTLQYAPSVHVGPSVTAGSLIDGAMMVANTTIPGTIKIGIISTKAISGSGPIVQIGFAENKGTGGITLLSVKLVSSDLTVIPAGPDAGPIPGPVPGPAPGEPSNTSQPRTACGQ